jgi:hypothetical protein
LTLSHTGYLTFVIANILGILTTMVPLSNFFSLFWPLQLISLFPLTNPYLPSCLTNFLISFSHVYEISFLSSLSKNDLAYVYKRSKYTGSHYIANAFEVVTVLISTVFVVVKKHERFSWTLFVMSVVYCWIKNGVAVGI